jgi:uncharacterized membrane protein YdjX (TVP38/TMEM64 family)
MPNRPLWKWSLLSVGLLLLIIVPFALFEQDLSSFAQRSLDARASAWAIAGSLIALLASDILLPIPSSFVATAAGYLLGFWWGSAATWAGLMAGTLVGYFLGLRFGRGLALRLVGESELDRVASSSKQFGDWMIIAFRAVPVLAEASVVFAGLTAMPARRFLLLTGLANLGVAASYGAVGAFAVEANSFLLAFAGSIVLPGAAMLLARLAGRRY